MGFIGSTCTALPGSSPSKSTPGTSDPESLELALELELEFSDTRGVSTSAAPSAAVRGVSGGRTRPPSSLTVNRMVRADPADPKPTVVVSAVPSASRDPSLVSSSHRSAVPLKSPRGRARPQVLRLGFRVQCLGFKAAGPAHQRFRV
jgi:hypothetical protein